MTTPRPRIRVLVVDDSVVIRRLVTDVLKADPQIEVVGVAEHGMAALEKVAALKPDAVTMDIEMPKMNGIEAVREIRKTQPRLPIVMFSTLTERGASATLDALAAGASDYVTKPANVGSVSESRQNIRDQLIPKLIALTSARRLVVGAAAAVPVRPATPAPRRAPRTTPFAVLAIGCSTGGPDALATVLRSLPAELGVPVVVVQHMPPLFTKMLAQRLDTGSGLAVREAENGDPLLPGHVLIAPGGRHLALKRTAAGASVQLNDDPPENFCRPAVDVMFRSVAATYKDRALALVLTGMGRDGALGAKVIREAGGEVFAQDELTSVVWGMPGAVVASGQADRIIALPDIPRELSTALGRKGDRPDRPREKATEAAR
jgi:two-component system chemotaxis response regulator CheB